MKLETSLDEEYICGIDEVGRGALAGPVVAGAVIMPKEMIEGITDSKKISKKKRERLYDLIRENALAYGLGIVDNRVIDRINIKEATRLAMKEALDQVREVMIPDLVLVDAEKIDTDLKTMSIIKGDEKSYNIGAASILAKVYRDRLLYDFDKTYPGYSFLTNVGYGTKAHRQAIKDIGYCSIHRKSFLKKMGEIKKSENW